MPRMKSAVARTVHPSDAVAVTAQGRRTIREWQSEMHAIARDKGWWNNPKTGRRINPNTRIAETIALIHSEASEALEEFREGRMDLWYSESKIGPKPEGFGVELADIVIRAMDTAESLGIDLEALMMLKADYNARRPFRHGGKRA